MKEVVWAQFGQNGKEVPSFEDISGGGAKYSDFLSKIQLSSYVLRSQSVVEILYID